MRKRTVKQAFAAGMAAFVMMTSAIPVFAAGSSDTQEMYLSMSKAPEYTMTIPASQDIPFGTVDTGIGDLYVTGNIGTKQQVQVTAEKTDFVDEKDDANSFSFDLQCSGTDFSGAIWSSDQLRSEAATKYALTVHIPTETWGNTKAGTYKATLTFKAELQDVQ
ncbi:MAG: cation transporter [Lachnospiraceae bacterium]|nr:cation transporter [Lachnospiraceae bacterium]